MQREPGGAGRAHATERQLLCQKTVHSGAHAHGHLLPPLTVFFAAAATKATCLTWLGGVSGGFRCAVCSRFHVRQSEAVAFGGPSLSFAPPSRVHFLNQISA